jgi:type III polyketide synthase
LSALRLANSFAQIPSSKPARILVIATEVTSTLVRSELEELDRSSGKMGSVGVCLFSDGASAMVVGGGEVQEGGESPSGLEPLRFLNADVVMSEVTEKASFEVIKTLTETLPDTVPDLGFNVDENGWKVSLPLYISHTTQQDSNADR